MSTLKNKVQLIGHLGVKPEIKITEGGKKLAKIRLATNELLVNEKGEQVEETQWHNITAWGKTAEIVEKYCVKGQHLMIEGKLVSHNYDDKDGIKRYVTEIHAYEVLMLSKKKYRELIPALSRVVRISHVTF